MKTTKTLERIEEKMSGLDAGSMRYQVLQSAKEFKASWVNLGRALFSVWKDKLYKGWGYNAFDSYVSRELGIRKQTAMKLLRSYYFLEKEEPDYLKEGYANSQGAALVPDYESIDVLRLAKNKKDIDENDYANFKKEILQKGKDAREAKKELTALIKKRQEFLPQESRDKKRVAAVKRFLGTLRALKNEIEDLKLLPSPLIREAAELIKKLEAQIL